MKIWLAKGRSGRRVTLPRDVTPYKRSLPFIWRTLTPKIRVHGSFSFRVILKTRTFAQTIYLANAFNQLNPIPLNNGEIFSWTL